jgi:chemotaxis protein MotB
MILNLTAAARVVPLTTLMLSGRVWQSDYDKLQAQNQQLHAQVSGLQRAASFVEAGDLLFLEGGYQLSRAGRAELSNNIVPKLTGLQNAKIVVYGYTDNLPVGPQVQRAGINDNLTLSSRRARDVVTYLIAQGVNPNIILVKGIRRHPSGRPERQTARPGAEPAHRHHRPRDRRAQRVNSSRRIGTVPQLRCVIRSIRAAASANER